jgi:hypothetical protein
MKSYYDDQPRNAHYDSEAEIKSRLRGLERDTMAQLRKAGVQVDEWLRDNARTARQAQRARAG